MDASLSHLPFVSLWMVMFIAIGLALATSFCKYPKEIISYYKHILSISGHFGVDSW